VQLYTLGEPLIWLSKQLEVAKSKEPKHFWIALYATF